MQVTVNGETQDIPAETTVSGLLGLLGLTGPVAVERNQEVVPRVDHVRAVLAEGDVIEIVHFVGGG